MPNARKPLFFTVVVPTRDRSRLIVDTLRSLLDLDYSANEILVCDQSSDDSTLRVVRELRKKVAPIRYQRTVGVGISANRNAGLRLSKANIVAFVDDDCIADRNWLRALSEEFNDPTVAGVFGRVLPFEQSHRSGTELGLKDSSERAVYRSWTPPWHIGHGGNMAFRRNALVALGGFDPLLGTGGVLRSGEDADAILKLFAGHWSAVYTPEALVYHKQWKDWNQQKEIQRSYGIGTGALFAKHIRLRSRFAFKFLAVWIWQLGVRRVAAGAIKWRSWRVMYLGYCQLVYPLLGILRSRRYPIDRLSANYRELRSEL